MSHRTEEERPKWNSMSRTNSTNKKKNDEERHTSSFWLLRWDCWSTLDLHAPRQSNRELSILCSDCRRNSPVNQNRRRRSISPERDRREVCSMCSSNTLYRSDAFRWFLCWSFLWISTDEENRCRSCSSRTNCLRHVIYIHRLGHWGNRGPLHRRERRAVLYNHRDWRHEKETCTVYPAFNALIPSEIFFFMNCFI